MKIGVSGGKLAKGENGIRTCAVIYELGGELTTYPTTTMPER